MLAQKTVGKFDGDETVSLSGLSPGAQFILPRRVKSRRQWLKIHSAGCAAKGSVPGQIQAKFQAVWMKTARPIESGIGVQFKIVPLNADTQFLKIPVKLLPVALSWLPDDCLAQQQNLWRKQYGLRGVAL